MSPHRCAAVSCQRGGNVITNLHLVIWLLWGVAVCASHLYLLLHSSFTESVIYKEQKSWVSSLHCEQISSIQLFVMWLPPRAESCSQQTHSHECRFAKVRAEEEARARAPLWYSVHPCSRWLRQPRPGFRQTAAGVQLMFWRLQERPSERLKAPWSHIYQNKCIYHMSQHAD